MNRLFLREESGRCFLDKKKFKIAVCGIGQGTGATTIASTLAFLLSKKVDILKKSLSICFVEMTIPDKGKSSLFYSLNLEEKFGKNGFYDWFGHMKKGDLKEYKSNIFKGVNWILHSAEKADKCYTESVGMIKGITGNIIIADSPKLEELKYFDMVIAVIDPMPSKVCVSAEVFSKIKEFELEQNNVVWIVNFMNDYVPWKNMEKIAGFKEAVFLPALEREIFYKCEYGGDLLIDVLMRSKEKNGKIYLRNIGILCEKILNLYE